MESGLAHVDRKHFSWRLAMIDPGRISVLRFLSDTGSTIAECARRCHMDWETAKKYADSSTPLNTPKKVRQYRNRVDPLDAFWGEIVAMLGGACAGVKLGIRDSVLVSFQ